MIIALLFLILLTLIFPGFVRLIATLLLFAFLFAIAGVTDHARADECDKHIRITGTIARASMEHQ